MTLRVAVSAIWVNRSVRVVGDFMSTECAYPGRGAISVPSGR